MKVCAGCQLDNPDYLYSVDNRTTDKKATTCDGCKWEDTLDPTDKRFNRYRKGPKQNK